MSLFLGGPAFYGQLVTRRASTDTSVAHILCSCEEVKARQPPMPLSAHVQGIFERAMLDAAKPECVS